MTQPAAKIVLDSTTAAGHRLTTFEVVCHRFVLAEFNTHRVMSRNSASSRAIPFSKQLARVMNDPAIPVSWPAEQPGMQGGEEIDNPSLAEMGWLRARDWAVNTAQSLDALGVHKSVVNRILEPFMWHTIVVSATAYSNFFALRCNPMAQPEIRVAAEAMHEAYVNSTPILLSPGDWHRDFEQDIQLYNRLTSANPMHSSPLEHVATPQPLNAGQVWPYVWRGGMRIPPDEMSPLTLPMYGNLLGWHQLRFDVEAANGYQAYS